MDPKQVRTHHAFALAVFAITRLLILGMTAYGSTKLIIHLMNIHWIGVC